MTEKLRKNKRGVKCECCKRVMKLYYKSVSGNENICRFCYSNCESITGVPYCHIKRKQIGGHWSDKRSNTFTKLDGTTGKRNVREYFDNELWS